MKTTIVVDKLKRTLSKSKRRFIIPVLVGIFAMLFVVGATSVSHILFQTTKGSAHATLQHGEQRPGSKLLGGVVTTSVPQGQQTSPTTAHGALTSTAIASGAPSPQTPALLLSATSLTLHKMSPTDGATAHLSITSNVGAITQPIPNNYQKTVAIEDTHTAPSATYFRSQWNFTLSRINNTFYGADSMDFTAQTTDGKTLSAHLTITIEPTPSFTVTKGALERTSNADGTVTYTAHFTLNPGPYFGNPQLHMCIMQNGYCTTTQDFTYAGNNNLSMSQTITPFSPGNFDITVAIDGWYTNGSAIMSWHDSY